MLACIRNYFLEMVQRIPVLGQRLVALMSDRIREITRQERSETNDGAGKAFAGLAHELNNPAAAAQRAAKSLREAMENVRDEPAAAGLFNSCARPAESFPSAINLSRWRFLPGDFADSVDISATSRCPSTGMRCTISRK